jgi:ABC-type multidrug transport system ATPase subunit
VSAVLEASGLTVRRGRRTVLSDVSLTFRAGEAIHVAGANGSGKTSLLRVLAGLGTPRAGVLRRPESCAFVPEKVVLASAMRCGEWLRAMRRVRGLEPLDWQGAVVASGLERELLGRSSATLSRGMLQRIAVVEAVHSESALLLFDEAFSGLDAAGRQWLGAELERCLGDGACVALTEHSEGAGGELRLTDVVELEDGRCRRRRLAAEPADRASQVGVVAEHADGRRLDRAVRAADVDGLLRSLLSAGWHVVEVRPREAG